MATVDVAKIESFLNLTKQRIGQLVKEGMPREGRGQYDAIKCAAWYIRYLQSALEKKAVPTLDGGFVGEREARVRSVTADADLKEMELAKQRGLYISLADYEKEFTDLVLTTKARIMAIAPRLSADLVGETSRVTVQAKIEKACKEALAYLAKGTVPDDTNNSNPGNAPERKG